MNLLARISFLIFWLILCALAITNYPGSNIHFVIFSLTFLVMLMSAFNRQVSYGYLFLVVMLWLGFWFKLTVHLLFDYPFTEPTGYFDGTPFEWDEVLRVATGGGLAVMVARLIYGFVGNLPLLTVKKLVFKPPVWYSAKRRQIWGLVMFFCISLSITNACLNIQQAGLVPTFNLIWPFNAVTYVLLSSGLAFFIATLIWWDISLRHNISLVVHFILIASFVTAISLLSRATFIFQAGPQLLAIYKNNKLVFGWSSKNIIIVCILFFVLLVTSNTLVNLKRADSFSTQSSQQNILHHNKTIFHDLYINPVIFTKFAVDRWIGLEGLMTAVSYPKKGKDLFMKVLTERSKIGESPFYNEISQSNYQFSDLKKFQFTALAGPLAFFYFTNSLWAVVIGMMIIVLLIFISETLVNKFFSNPLLNSLWGLTMANAIAQMGVAPYGLLVYFFEIIFILAIIGFFQSKFFAGLVLKTKVFFAVRGKTR